MITVRDKVAVVLNRICPRLLRPVSRSILVGILVRVLIVRILVGVIGVVRVVGIWRGFLCVLDNSEVLGSTLQGVLIIRSIFVCCIRCTEFSGQCISAVFRFFLECLLYSLHPFPASRH